MPSSIDIALPWELKFKREPVFSWMTEGLKLTYTCSRQLCIHCKSCLDFGILVVTPVAKTPAYVADPGSASNATLVHQILPLYSCFLRALYWSSFTSKTANKDQKVEQLFCLYSFKSGDMHELCGGQIGACNLQALIKVTCTKSGMFQFP